METPIGGALFVVACLAVALILGLHSFFASSDKPPPKRSIRERHRKPRHQPFDAPSSTAQPGNKTLRGRAYIVDGDSLVIEKTQVRLFGVDAPEMNHPYGKNAKWTLLALCKGQIIRAEIVAVDAYGRTVAMCYLQDGRDLSGEMVKLGFAIDWEKFSGGQYRALEIPNARRKMWLADARQKGQMQIWEQYDAQQASKVEKS